MERYQSKMSGPLLDRLDVHVVLPPVSVEALATRTPGEPSRAVRERVTAARDAQLGRFESGETSAPTNARLTGKDLERVAHLAESTRTRLASAVARHGVSARGYVKILRVARTIADLERSDRVASRHVDEALQGRLLDGGTF